MEEEKKTGKGKKRSSAAAAATISKTENQGAVQPVNSDDITISCKKPKSDIDEDIFSALVNCKTILDSQKSSLSLKLICLQEFFQLIVDKNVNIVLIDAEFTSWLKSTLTSVLQDAGTKGKIPVDVFNFLQIALKIGPTVFESVLDNVFLISFKDSKNDEDEEGNSSKTKFMRNLLQTFDKLRRFPKFVAKYLCCIRDHLKQEEKGWSWSLGEILNAIGPIVSSLTSGQTIDLWKTLQHNLELECVQKIVESSKDDPKIVALLSVVTDLYVEFLLNVKVADFTIPSTTIERVSEMMKQLRENCLKPFGLWMADRRFVDFDPEMLKSFLRLTLIYDQLNLILLRYNSKYQNQSKSNEVALKERSDQFPSFLNPQHWLQLSKVLKTQESSTAMGLLVHHVAHKLISKGTAERPNEIPIDIATDFILSHQSNNLPNETITVISEHVLPSKLLDLAKSFVVYQNNLLHLIEAESPKLHFALVLESIAELLNRIQKMKLLPKLLGQLSSHVFDPENRNLLLQYITHGTPTGNVIQELLSVANKAIHDSGTIEKLDSVEFSPEALFPIMNCLSTLDFENYSKEVKTFVSLCFILILISITHQAPTSSALLELATSVLTSTASQPSGNEILFKIQWISLFRWFNNNVRKFDSTVQSSLCVMILNNIYVSPKLVAEFEEEIETTLVVEKENPIRMICFEFFLKELKRNANKKLLIQLQAHSSKLARLIVLTHPEDEVYFHSCFLSQVAFTMGVMDNETLSNYKGSLHLRIESVLKLLRANAETVGVELGHSIQFLSEVLKERKKLGDALPKKVFAKAAKSCFRMEILNSAPIHFIKELLEGAKSKELKAICNSISEKMNLQDPSKNNFFVVLHLLSELIDAELSPNCKPIRRQLLQEIIPQLVLLSLDFTSPQLILAWNQLQIKLLRRRGAIVNLKTLALFLTSVTRLELPKEISDYKTIFCSLGELLNSFAVHRLDVLSFRSHIYLQCFASLIESLTLRADQKNKLDDIELSALRQCAHSIERLCQSMKGGLKEFGRVAPYFVAVVIKQFETVSVYPGVKSSLLGGINKLLDLCDSHGLALLNSLLSVGSKEMLKTIYEEYKKFYQYKGRV